MESQAVTAKTRTAPSGTSKRRPIPTPITPSRGYVVSLTVPVRASNNARMCHTESSLRRRRHHTLATTHAGAEERYTMAGDDYRPDEPLNHEVVQRLLINLLQRPSAE